MVGAGGRPAPGKEKGTVRTVLKIHCVVKDRKKGPGTTCTVLSSWLSTRCNNSLLK